MLGRTTTIRTFRVVKRRDPQRRRWRLDQAAVRRMLGQAFLHVGCQSRDPRWLAKGHALLRMVKYTKKGVGL